MSSHSTGDRLFSIKTPTNCLCTNTGPESSLPADGLLNFPRSHLESFPRLRRRILADFPPLFIIRCSFHPHVALSCGLTIPKLDHCRRFPTGIDHQSTKYVSLSQLFVVLHQLMNVYGDSEVGGVINMERSHPSLSQKRSNE